MDHNESFAFDFGKPPAAVRSVEQRLDVSTIARHRHSTAYAAIVLDGSYMEAGDRGSWRVRAGDVVAHRDFEAHFNTVLAGGARVLNFPLGARTSLPAVFRVADVDALIRAAREEPGTAAELLTVAQEQPCMVRDWPDALAKALRDEPTLRIGAWAAMAGLAPATVSRGFMAAFGTSPVQYRNEVRALLALRRIREQREPLTDVAHDCGFADQAHLTRAIVALTAAPPRSWRPGQKHSRPHSR